MRKSFVRNAKIARLCLIYDDMQQVRIICGSAPRQLNLIGDFAVLYAWYGKVKLSPRS